MEHSKLEDKIRYAKVQLMTKSVFLSTICLRLRHQISDVVPTAGTNGLNIYYNPDFIANLDTNELTGLLAHEVWHVAYHHLTRLNGRDPRLWNIAGDYVINYMLTKANFTLPKGGLYDPQYADMTTEQVYDIIFDKAEEYPDFHEDILQPGAGDGTDQDQLSPEDIRDKLTSIVVQAQTQSMMANKAAGEIPGEINRMIDDLINPKLDWKQLLDRYVSEKVKNDFSWQRPNRRFMPDHYLPSMYSDTIGNITIAIDTSGSINEDDLRDMLTEIESIREIYKPKELTIIDCDYIIHNVHKVDEHTDILGLKFSGCGGTQFEPVFNYCRDNPPTLLIYFTDLWADPIKEHVEYDVLWVCTDSTHDPAEIGETIYTDGTRY